MPAAYEPLPPQDSAFLLFETANTHIAPRRHAIFEPGSLAHAVLVGRRRAGRLSRGHRATCRTGARDARCARDSAGVASEPGSKNRGAAEVHVRCSPSRTQKALSWAVSGSYAAGIGKRTHYLPSPSAANPLGTGARAAGTLQRVGAGARFGHARRTGLTSPEQLSPLEGESRIGRSRVGALLRRLRDGRGGERGRAASRDGAGEHSSSPAFRVFDLCTPTASSGISSRS